LLYAAIVEELELVWVCCGWRRRLSSPWLQEHSNRKINSLWLILSARMKFSSDYWKWKQGVLQNQLHTVCRIQ
jgi:hypothetical protein